MLGVSFENFLQAVRENDITEVECLMETGYDPNVIFEENGFSPLHLAAWYDRSRIIKLLREHGAKVDKEEQNTKKTALHIAAYYGYLDSCKVLMQDNSSINSEDVALFTPLHYAALRGHLKIVELLSENIKDLWKGSVCGTPIDVAIRHQNIDVTDYIIKKLNEHFSMFYNESSGSSISNYLKKITTPIFHGDPIYFATLIGAENIIQLLLSYRLLVELNVIGLREGLAERTPLHLAAEKGYSKIVELLLNDPACFIREGFYTPPLELAMRNGHKSTIDVFVNKGSKPWLVDRTRLFGERPKSTIAAAIWDGNYQKLKEILEHEGKEVLFKRDKQDKDPLLQLAILYRQNEIAKLFIEYGGKELILQTDDSQMTALHRAAFHGNLELYQLILQTIGTELLKQPSEVFGTPLDCALVEGHIEIVNWTLGLSSLDLSFEELFLCEGDNWVLMDLNPKIGRYFTKTEKLLGFPHL